jgi:hypothetical protein
MTRPCYALTVLLIPKAQELGQIKTRKVSTSLISRKITNFMELFIRKNILI